MFTKTFTVLHLKETDGEGGVPTFSRVQSSNSIDGKHLRTSVSRIRTRGPDEVSSSMDRHKKASIR